MTQASHALNHPPFLLFDLRPFQAPLMVVFDKDIAEEITRSSPTFSESTPKSPTLSNIRHLTGDRSMLMVNVGAAYSQDDCKTGESS